MASAMIHIVVANELNKKLNRDSNKLLIGTIAPDIARIVGIDRNITHFQDIDKRYPNINNFLVKYKKELNDDFVMGYYIHLLTDYFWYKYFFTELANDNTMITKNGVRIKLDYKLLNNYIYNDYTNLNIDLIEKYNLDLKIFYNEIPEIDDIIKEFPMKDIKKVVDKIGIIIENSNKHKSYLFDIKNVITFINTCVDLIDGILNDNNYYDFK